MSAESSPFSVLIGEDLGGVVFVRNYLQLQFDAPTTLTVHTPLTIRSGGKEATSGQEVFANLLIGQINKVVIKVEVRNSDAIVLQFADGSTISVSLRDEDYAGPEAVVLHGKNNLIVVE
jgi:hypothetical protein